MNFQAELKSITFTEDDLGPEFDRDNQEHQEALTRLNEMVAGEITTPSGDTLCRVSGGRSLTWDQLCEAADIY